MIQFRNVRLSGGGFAHLRERWMPPMQVNAAQRILLFFTATVLALAGLYHAFAPGGWTLAGLLALVLAAGAAFLGLAGGAGVGNGGALPGQAARRNGGSVSQATCDDFVQVEKYLAITVSAADGLYNRLVERFHWDMAGAEGDSLPRQIFRESCTILAYYLVCLSLSGGANLALLGRIRHSLKHRTAMHILRLDKRCGPEDLADSEICKERSAQGLALIDSFQYLFDHTVESFHEGRAYPLNDLMGGILMLFEGQVSPEDGYWETKYGDAVHAELAEITRKRRSPA